MLVIIGSIIVLVSVLGGYVLSHGSIGALWQPYELLIIFGAAVGAFISANSMDIVKGARAMPWACSRARNTRSRITWTCCRCSTTSS